VNFFFSEAVLQTTTSERDCALNDLNNALNQLSEVQRMFLLFVIYSI
jgi:hypothetical protein